MLFIIYIFLFMYALYEFFSFVCACLCVHVWQWLWMEQNPRLEITVQQHLFLVEREYYIVFCGEKSGFSQLTKFLSRWFVEWDFFTSSNMRNEKSECETVRTGMSLLQQEFCVFFPLSRCLEGRFLCLFPQEEWEIWSQAARTGLVFCSKGWVSLWAKL